MSNMKISMTTALLFLTSLASLATAAQARTLASGDRHKNIAMIVEYERGLSPPPPPISAPPTKEITNYIGSHKTKFPPPLTSNLPLPRSQIQTDPCVEGRAKQLSPPPPPASSTSPTQSELNIASPCVAGNTCTSLFLTTAVDNAKTQTSPPSSPELSTQESQLQMSEAPCATGKTKPLPAPPAPESSKSPIQSENKDSPCAADNPSSSLITTVADNGKRKILPPPPPAPSQSQSYDSPRVAGNPCSSSVTLKTDYGKRRLSPPPTPASSKSPTQSAKSGSACVGGNSCGRWQFIVMITDNNRYGRRKPPPPSPEAAPPKHYELTRLISS